MEKTISCFQIIFVETYLDWDTTWMSAKGCQNAPCNLLKLSTLK